MAKSSGLRVGWFRRFSRSLLTGVVAASLWLASAPTVLAGEAQDAADLAVANILFEYDGAGEFATYRIDGRGFVEITFASNMPDALYSEILNRLQHDPAIRGVLAGRGGPACSLF